MSAANFGRRVQVICKRDDIVRAILSKDALKFVLFRCPLSFSRDKVELMLRNRVLETVYMSTT